MLLRFFLLTVCWLPSCYLWHGKNFEDRILAKGEGLESQEEFTTISIPSLVTAVVTGPKSRGGAPKALPDAPCSCTKKYFSHYPVKGCTPVYEEGCDCPVRFECAQQSVSNSTCSYRGQIYQRGETVPTTNPCRMCTCRLDYLTNEPTISCTSIECPHLFLPYPPGCYGVYEPGHCCPVRTECRNSTEEESHVKAGKTCELDGRTYRFGEKMYPQDNECVECICTEDWDSANATQTGCTAIDCLIEVHSPELRRGCIPIYHENVCCPIEFHCPPLPETRGREDDSPSESETSPEFPGIKEDDLPEFCKLPDESGPCFALFTRFYYSPALGRCEEFIYGGCQGNQNNFLTRQQCEDACQPSRVKKAKALVAPDKGDMCFFDNVYHPRGSILEIRHPTNCVECTCQTPPDFTCVHRSCPNPPNNDYVNCRPSYVPGECCPTYTCNSPPTVLLNDTTRDGRAVNTTLSTCDDLTCSEGQACMLTEKPCGQSTCLVPACFDINPACYPRVCDEECTFDGYTEDHCPKCLCPQQQGTA